MELAISFILAVALVEVYEWLPWFSRWLIKLAISRLLIDEKERYREEWNATLNEFPNSIVKAAHALSLLLSTRQMNLVSLELKVKEFGDRIGALTKKHHENQEGICDLEVRFSDLRTSNSTLKLTLQEKVAVLRRLEPRITAVTMPAVDPRPVFLEPVTALEKWGHAVEALLNKVATILESRGDAISSKIVETDVRVRAVRAQHARTEKLFRDRRLPELAAFLETLGENVEQLGLLLDDDDVDPDHAAAMREVKRLQDALVHATARGFRALPAAK